MHNQIEITWSQKPRWWDNACHLAVSFSRHFSKLEMTPFEKWRLQISFSVWIVLYCVWSTDPPGRHPLISMLRCLYFKCISGMLPSLGRHDLRSSWNCKLFLVLHLYSRNALSIFLILCKTSNFKNGRFAECFIFSFADMRKFEWKRNLGQETWTERLNLYEM